MTDSSSPISPESRWRRPVPSVGDTSSAAQRAADPAAWAFPEPVIAALDEVIAARRDIRRYRPTPVPDELLGRVLRAGHAAPSVGHSQPWRFIVVKHPDVRERAAAMADRERLAQAALLEPDRARRLLDLQLEGIREAPIGVVVACDRRAAAAGVLGRATFPDTDLWSCACAIENMWLTARALGLGLGWVTLFRPDELRATLRLPAGVETLGWLCLGWPNERPPAPGLERRGWSRRVPLSEVVFNEQWPTQDEGRPDPPPSYLRAPTQDQVVAVSDDTDVLLTPPGSLGILDRVLDGVSATGGASCGPGTLVLVGADHPVARHGVSAYRCGITREVLAAAVCGQALGTVSARSAGMSVTVVDAGVDGPAVPGAVAARPDGRRGDLRDRDAMERADVDGLLALGRRLGREASSSGLVAIGEVGLGNTTVAGALCCALLDLDPGDVVGLGAGADAETVQRKTDVVRAALHRLAAQGRLPADDPLDMLAAVGGPEIAVLVGVILGAAESGVCVVLDGLATGMAALIAARLEPAVHAFLIAGQVSRERAHPRVLTELGLEPLLDLRMRAGEGAGACLAVGLLLHGLRTRRATARTEPGDAQD